MQAEHDQRAAGDASWPRASSVPDGEDRSGEGYWDAAVDWSDKLEGLQFLENHTQFHLLLALLSITLRPMQEQNSGQEGLEQEAQWRQEPFQTPLRNSSMCAVYDAQALLRCPGRGSNR